MRVMKSLLLRWVFVTAAWPYCNATPYQKHNPILPKREALDTDYDYVVVGSGPGGGPTAANLAAAGYKVLLIDAGGDSGEALIESVPAMFAYATQFEDTQWDFFVTRSPDPAVQAKTAINSYRLADGSIYTGPDPPADATSLGTLYPRAGTLGGCSRHNAVVTIRAFDSDWETIAETTGDTSWSAANFQKLFKNIERCNYLPNSVAGHGFTGWLWTELSPILAAITDLKAISVILSAASAMGISIIPSLIGTAAGVIQVLLKDVNTPGKTISTGLYQVPLGMKEGVRGGARDRILQVAEATNSDGSRKYHLDIKLNTLVTKILFDESGDVPRATGVKYLEGQSLYRADPRSKNGVVSGEGVVNAGREVIVAGGAFNTPQLLMLSGVGAADELNEFDIPVVVDLPGVGKNLRDHIEVSVISEASSDFTILEGCTFMQGYPEIPDPCLERYLNSHTATGKGIYASSGVAVGAVLRTSAATQVDPDIWVYGGPINFLGFFPGWANVSLGDAHHWTWISLKASTKNTAGAVSLATSDPRDVPNIAFNTFEDEEAANQDLQALYESISYSRRAMDRVLPLDGTFKEVTPGRDVKSEQDVKEFARTQSFGHHACCTAPIGGDDDPNAVLDSNFRVRGTKGLRVVDASSWPFQPGVFTVLPIYLMAEKASASIVADAK